MNKLLPLVTAATVCFFIAGCTGFVPIYYPDNSLNIYNTYWDNFAGVIEKGKIYEYSNKGFDRKLQFKAKKVLSSDVVLFSRKEEMDRIYSEYKKICEQVTFAIISKHTYADGATLKDGFYECIGTGIYELQTGTNATIYIFAERNDPQKEQSQNESGTNYSDADLQKLCTPGLTQIGHPTTVTPPKKDQSAFSSHVLPQHSENSLNIFNTYWDSFGSIMKKGQIYQYSNQGFDRRLQFRILQVLPDHVLVIRNRERDLVDGKYQTFCEEVVFAIISKHTYADGATLKDGFYECVGTATYKNPARMNRTVYVLVERDNPQKTSKQNIPANK